ncbi:hypothetical protein BCR36DRAFT_587157 [Piromyces finnis]|uniref:Vacuolar protein-sorting-associated protein 36 n=1 Tax=Piromyces finnis TaxID=1754191 RepID=A0A1Y1UWF7_9FUNG|nr:hypothetical protein BCR36DRAFT_587157 [Piromyces finnis]|eukprot:ORX42448.1 hypothetical protein BCR36DRAFT_587157 [Piromyces finnis]
MDFDTFELTTNNYPVLQNNEKIVKRQNNVTILTNKQKYQRGILYLTNLRLLWLKLGSIENKTVAINLEDIISKETNSNILSASTIKLEINKSKKKDESSNDNNKENVSLEEWECQICNQMNNGADTVCVLCGVPKIEDKGSVDEIDNKPKKKNDAYSKPPVSSTSGYVKNDYNKNNNLSLSFSPISLNKSLPEKPKEILKYECPACTFINEGNNDQCKVCMTRLDGVKPLPPPRTKPIICSICFYSNEPDATVCSICSMPLKYCASSFDSEFSNTNNNNNNNLLFPSSNSYINSASSIHYPTLAETSNISIPNGYDVINPYSNISMDDTSKETDDDDNDDDDFENTTPVTPSQVSSLNNLKQDTIKVKLLFKSGQTAFYSDLSTTLKEEQWKKVNVIENKTSKVQRIGVAGVIRNIQESQKNTNEIMNQAFQDLNNLMKKASEMVAIAESISQKINKDNSMEGSKEQNQLKEIMHELGISNPVTKKSTGGVYYQELAKQLSRFIIKLFEKHNNVMTLPEIYCLYNRARGVELVSPEDLYKACNMFEKLQIPLKLRKFQSGLIIVEDDIFT